MEDSIDFVIAWVDGNDKNWLEQKNKYSPNKIDVSNDIYRYRDMDCLKYWFRAVEKYTPWVNNIYFVTWGHLPKWLNKKNPKLKIINHKDYIPEKYLPTFSSHTIELNMHKIEGLSEKFVYFNDDMFICDYMSPKDFFINELPCESAIISPIFPQTDFEHIIVNNIKIINRNFDKNKVVKENKEKWFNYKYGFNNIRTLILNKWPLFCGIRQSHLPTAFLKQFFYEVWDKEYDELDQTCSHKFRKIEDINQWLVKDWQLAKGSFEPRNPNIGKNMKLSDENSEIIHSIKNNKYKMICINDSDNTYNFDEAKQEIIESFEYILPEKSDFEITLGEADK